MTVLIATTIASYKCDGQQEMAWLTHADRWTRQGRRFFASLQLGHGHDERFAWVRERLDAIGAVTWTFSIDAGDSAVDGDNRLTGICMGRNLVHEYVNRTPDVSHVLFLDSDVMPAADAIDRLLALDYPIVGGHVPEYALDGPAVTDLRLPAGRTSVKRHWNTAGFLLLTRDVVITCRWRWDADNGITDDPSFAGDAIRAGFGMTWVDHSVLGIHVGPLVRLDQRGHDLSIIREGSNV